MGQEVTCAVRHAGRSGPAKVLLETDVLVVGAPFRLRVRFEALRAIDVDREWLVLSYPEGPLALELGAAAGRWADKIRHPPTRLQKLGVRPGWRAAVVGALDDTFIGELEHAGVVLVRRISGTVTVDAIFLAAPDRAALKGIKGLMRFLEPAGALWIVRPRGVATITEAETMQAGRDAGLTDVKVVRFSDTQTAEKFVIPVAQRAAAPSRLPKTGLRSHASDGTPTRKGVR